MYWDKDREEPWKAFLSLSLSWVGEGTTSGSFNEAIISLQQWMWVFFSANKYKSTLKETVHTCFWMFQMLFPPQSSLKLRFRQAFWFTILPLPLLSFSTWGIPFKVLCVFEIALHTFVLLNCWIVHYNFHLFIFWTRETEQFVLITTYVTYFLSGVLWCFIIKNSLSTNVIIKHATIKYIKNHVLLIYFFIKYFFQF